MITWLTHLRIAVKIKERISDVNLSYLMLGIIAPSCSIPDANEEILHYKVLLDNDAYSIDTTAFYSKHLTPEKILLRSDRTRSFLWGYYFHLLSDKLWQENYMNSIKKEYEKEQKEKSEKTFSDYVVEEMDALDFIYLKNNGTEIFEELKNTKNNIFSFNDIDIAYLYSHLNHIIEHYENQTQKPEISFQFLNESIMDEFVDLAAQTCINKLI